MRKKTLVLSKALVAGLALWLSASTAAFGQTATFGQPIPLPGQINEISIDEARGLVYAGSFSAGRVEVVSMDTNQRIASFPVSPQPSGTSGMAVSHDGRWLVTTNLPVTFGVPQLSGVTVVNLNDSSDRRTHPLVAEPLGVAFAIGGKALIATTTSLQLFDPTDGSFSLLFEYETALGSATLPGVAPTLPREIVLADLTSSKDGKWIYGVTDEFIFSYQVRQPVGLLTIRLIETLVNEPIFNQVSAGLNGSYFMVGQLLLDNSLRVIADTPEAPETNVDFIGGTGIDSNIDTIYGAFGDLSAAGANDPNSHLTFGVLQVMDSDNLYVRQRLRLPERIMGEIVPAANGRFLYAVSESGLLFLPLDELPTLPHLEVNSADRNLFFQFDFCNQTPITKMLRIENPTNGVPTRFSLSVEPFRSSNRPAILFEPSVGVTPAVVKVTVDPGALGPVQGTNAIPIQIATDAVNVPQESLVISNVRDVDQRGEFYQVPGHLVGVVGDPIRDRFYVLDERNFLVHVFDSNDMRQIGSLRVGNSPTWMTITRDSNFLVVANSRGENVTVINLPQLRVDGNLFMSWQILQAGHYPVSLATDNLNVVIAARTSNNFGQLDTLHLPSKSVSTRQTLGVFDNRFDSDMAVAGHPDGNNVMIVDSTGTVGLWESQSQRLIIARRDFLSNVGGAVGAGPNYWVVGEHVMNASLVPLGDYDDAGAAQQSSGFALLPSGVGVRSVRPLSQVDTGAMQQIDPRDPRRLLNGVRMAEPPPERSPNTSFTQTLAALRDGRLISTSSAGIVAFAADYARSSVNPRVSAVTNGADFTRATAIGGLISIFGENLSPESQGAVDTPLPTRMASTCVSANGAPLPLLFVSPNQINAQMLFSTFGPVSVQVHNSSGTSDIFVKQVDPAAPAIFGVRGPDNGRFSAIFRENNTLSTLSNPLRPNEVAIIYGTGLGGVSPVAVAGSPASSSIFSETTEAPLVEIGGVFGEVLFSGLTPGFVGLYQINVLLPSFVPKGLEVPLTITMGANSTTTNVRIVD